MACAPLAISLQPNFRPMGVRSVSSAWLVRPAPRPAAAVRLFCIPYAGSGAAAYRGWAENAAALDVCYIQLPGRENRLREEPFTSMPALIEALAGELEAWDDRPYALYGHSLGGIIAFEVARAMRARGRRQPLHLFASASRAPHLPCQRPAIRDLPDLELLEEVHHRYESVPLQLMNDAELRELLLPCLRADLTVLETYPYVEAEPLACGITCFGAMGDRMVSGDALEQWRMHTSEKFRLQLIEGSHLFLQSARNILLAAVAAALHREPETASRIGATQLGGRDRASAL
jgi:medium-chain acyl-[acyl-carrier-protein] hydrolase